MVNSEKKLSRDAWVALNVEWSRSGLQQKEFCAQTGISHKAFANWRSRNKSALVAPPKAAKFQELNLIPVKVLGHETSAHSKKEAARSSAAHVAPSTISITSRTGHTLHIHDNFNEQTLLRVLKVLGVAGD